jgi:hypothetical protein
MKNKDSKKIWSQGVFATATTTVNVIYVCVI